MSDVGQITVIIKRGDGHLFDPVLQRVILGPGDTLQVTNDRGERKRRPRPKRPMSFNGVKVEHV